MVHYLFHNSTNGKCYQQIQSEYFVCPLKYIKENKNQFSDHFYS